MSERMWEMYEGFVKRGDGETHSEFMLSFYTDPDPLIDGLRKISCPSLVLLGEFDIVFIKPSEILAAEVPDVRHVILDGTGHMTAIEDPVRTGDEIIDFLETVGETGRANR